ncbi:STAS domain-containing protein [Paenibacillus sp. GSMTC-2017]|uniref:STAS domain-containing protein n=1 Tax=Paenibacillus sp. GSMTC-2017 TaxID=2794350 RepID=UPI0018D6E92C|nr:STAS domain-containing protein [Paenibacillus sp. GSMTC-2017]MBH5319950.1 STAS domain-containing protein [Paenibacillus sp. GSMTC-2017]
MKVEPFQIVHEETNGQHVLYLAGELDLSVVPQLNSALEPILQREDITLILNLSKLTYIDSTGIGIIVSILKTRDRLNAPFYVREIPAPIKRLFDLTGISKYLIEEAEA